jgi:hypothetical protein
MKEERKETREARKDGSKEGNGGVDVPAAEQTAVLPTFH